MNPREEHIRELAHQIWESEGKPDDQAARHWKLASLMVEAEERHSDLIKPLEPQEMLEPGNADDEQPLNH